MSDENRRHADINPRSAKTRVPVEPVDPYDGRRPGLFSSWWYLAGFVGVVVVCYGLAWLFVRVVLGPA